MSDWDTRKSGSTTGMTEECTAAVHGLDIQEILLRRLISTANLMKLKSGVSRIKSSIPAKQFMRLSKLMEW